MLPAGLVSLLPFLAFLDLVNATLPELAAHFQVLQFDLKVTSFSWFFAAFVSTLPVDCVMRIWDAFLAEGRTVGAAESWTLFCMPRMYACKQRCLTACGTVGAVPLWPGCAAEPQSAAAGDR